MKVWASRSGSVSSGGTATLQFEHAKGALRRVVPSATTGDATDGLQPGGWGFAVRQGNRRWPADAGSYFAAADVGLGGLREVDGMDWSRYGIGGSEGVVVEFVNWHNAALFFNVVVETG